MITTVIDVHSDEVNAFFADPVRFNRWASSQGIDIDATYRIEIHRPLLWPLKRRYARVFAFDLDVNGHVYLDETTGEGAKREPYDLPITTRPPATPAPYLAPAIEARLRALRRALRDALKESQ